MEEVKQERQEQEWFEKPAKREKRRMVESTTAKILAFWTLIFGFFIGILGVFATLYMEEESYYLMGYEKFVHDRMVSQIWNCVGTMNYYFKDEEAGEASASVQRYLERMNLSAELYEGDQLLWSFASEEEKESPYHFVCYTSVAMGQKDELELTYYLYVDPQFPIQDEFWRVERECRVMAKYAYLYPVAAVLGLLFVLASFTFLICSAGHHRGKEGISGGVLSRFPFDLVTVVFGGVGMFVIFLLAEILSYSGSLFEYLCALALASLGLAWGTVYLRELALRVKLGDLFRHTLVYALCRGIIAFIKGLPLVFTTCVVFIGIAALEFLGILVVGSAEVFVLWALEKAVLFPLVVYVALMCKRLQKGSEMLAAGNLDCQIDTSYMALAFKQHGENLNSIAQGMSAAVEQRLRSERLKTELITNVSHDLKTPLTSIINYANLIGSLIAGDTELENTGFLQSGGVDSEVSDYVEGGITEENGTEKAGAEETGAEQAITAGERERLSEYAEVLLRQSRRLKKLLEDLVEASKATTGNLEVHLQTCEVGVLLTQAVGEYEQRFGEKGLEPIVKQPEERITVMADGRHIWRVFDNLLNNICKYAQENTRVYLTVELESPEHVDIIFRNMSKYPLDIKGDELKERFVRGDQSRHMEGNGLGLSIAASLVELQGGTMEIVTDGDLFKVIIRAPVVKLSKEQEDK